MSKYVQFILAIAYAFITILALYIFFSLLGNGKFKLEGWIVNTIIAGWVIICITAAYWFTGIHLFFNQVRKPILEEERRLVLSMYEIQKKANDKRNYRLRVEESNRLNAYAIGYRTIVVSKGCLKRLILEENDDTRVDQFHILTRSTHPLLHNRIRRLEKQEGLRR